MLQVERDAIKREGRLEAMAEFRKMVEKEMNTNYVQGTKNVLRALWVAMGYKIEDETPQV